MDPLSIAAVGLSFIGKLFAGETANNSAKTRARALAQGAAQDRLESGLDAMVGLEDDERTIASATVAAAANGGGLSNARGVLDDLQRQSIFRARSAIYRGETQARAREREAAVTLQDGENAKTTGLIGATSSLLSGFAQASASSRMAAYGSR